MAYLPLNQPLPNPIPQPIQPPKHRLPCLIVHNRRRPRPTHTRHRIRAHRAIPRRRARPIGDRHRWRAAIPLLGFRLLLGRIAAVFVEDFGLFEFVYEGLFAGVQLVGYALRQGHEFDEEEVEAGDGEFGVGEVVEVREGGGGWFGHCGVIGRLQGRSWHSMGVWS